MLGIFPALSSRPYGRKKRNNTNWSGNCVFFQHIIQSHRYVYNCSKKNSLLKLIVWSLNEKSPGNCQWGVEKIYAHTFHPSVGLSAMLYFGQESIYLINNTKWCYHFRDSTHKFHQYPGRYFLSSPHKQKISPWSHFCGRANWKVCKSSASCKRFPFHLWIIFVFIKSTMNPIRFFYQNFLFWRETFSPSFHPRFIFK